MNRLDRWIHRSDRKSFGQKAVFLRFFCGRREGVSMVMVDLWPLRGRQAANVRPKCGRLVIVPTGCDGQNAKKRIFCGQKAVAGNSTALMKIMRRLPSHLAVLRFQ
jgi:hypothetical protein